MSTKTKPKRKKAATPATPDALTKHLCDLGGCVIQRCSKDWGGTYAWSIVDSGSAVCGYKTEVAAMEGFIADACGSRLGTIMLAMLKKLYKA